MSRLETHLSTGIKPRLERGGHLTGANKNHWTNASQRR